MSMLGAGELCRAILEDKDVARAFDLDADGEMNLFSTYSELRVVSMHGFPHSGTRTLATLGVGGAISFP